MNKIAPKKIFIVLLYVLLIILVSTVNPYFRKIYPMWHFYIMSLFNIGCITSLLFLYNPYSWSMKNINELRKEASYKKRKIIMLIVYTTILLIEMAVFCTDNYISNTYGSRMFNPFLQISVTVICAAGEEFVYKGALYRLLLESRVNKLLSIIIVCFLFALGHWRFDAFFLIMFALQLIMLFLFNLYPSIILLSLFHILWNLITFI